MKASLTLRMAKINNFLFHFGQKGFAVPFAWQSDLLLFSFQWKITKNVEFLQRRTFWKSNYSFWLEIRFAPFQCETFLSEIDNKIPVNCSLIRVFVVKWNDIKREQKKVKNKNKTASDLKTFRW